MDKVTASIDDIITLSKKLIAVPSIAGNSKTTKEIFAIVNNELNNFKPQSYTSQNTQSLLFSNKNNSKHFKIILNAHLDVVPSENKQFVPFIKKGKLYGRGAYDMKSAAAVMILLFKNLANVITYPLALQLVTDEEIGGYNGTRYQIEQGITADFVIAGENTDFEIRNKSKCLFWLKLKVKGKASHAAYLWNGDNALLKMYSVLNMINEYYPIPTKSSWQTTVNVAKIETNNNTFNKVPDECKAWLDIRVIPEHEHNFIKHFKNIIPKYVEIETAMLEKPAFTSPENPFIEKLQTTYNQITNDTAIICGANGTSDIRHYNTLISGPGVEFGPVGSDAHGNEEYVEVKSLETYYNVLERFLLSFE